MEEYIFKCFDSMVNEILKTMDKIEDEKCLNDLRIGLLRNANSHDDIAKFAYYKYVIKMLTNLRDDFENLYKNEIKKYINDNLNE